MTDFLTTMLPTQGMYCSVGIKTAIVRQSFMDSIEELEVNAIAHDNNREDAYFALATFKDSSSRKASNVAFLKCFFLDLDCGPNKNYAFQPQAAQAIAEFIDKTGLPKPFLVNSGGGIHVYWPLSENVDGDTWVRYAKALKVLCSQMGLFADPAVTADPARILRVPGTNNYKMQGQRPVQIITPGVVSTLEEFIAHLPEPTVDLTAARIFGMDSVTSEMAAGTYPKCSFARIAIKSVKGEGGGCEQMRNAIVNSASLEEPLWRAALSIAVRCEDGATAIHKVSSQHPEYTPERTEDKARATKGPTTCKWYRENYPDSCAGCKHVITSPILLGRVIEEAPKVEGGYTVEVDINPEDPDMLEAVVGDTGAIRVKVDIPEYPFPYFRGVNGGVYKRSRSADGDAAEEEVYRNDLYIVKRFFDSDEHGDGEGEMALIQLHMDRDGIRQFYAPVTTLFTKDKMRDLLIKNGVVAYGKQLDLLMAYFASSIRKLQAEFAANRTRSQMGWTPDMLGFVVGEVEYTPTGPKLAPPASGTRQLAPAFTPRGTLEEWKSIASFYKRPGLEAHALALCFGFGSPLLKFIGGTAVKGFQVHLKSNKSGSGKTTVQTVINSIFGHPTELLMTKDDTAASKMHMLGMMNSIAVTMDEITNMRDDELSDIAYGVTTGRGRHRMDASTNKMRTNNTSWCNITITSSNASVVDKLAQFKSTADGELRRVLEIEVPKIETVSKNEIDYLFGKLGKNYGVAGPIYLKYILANREKVINMLEATQAAIDSEFGFDQSDRYYSTSLACAFVGGTLAVKLGLVDLDISSVYDYTVHLIRRTRVVSLNNLGSPLLIAQETLSSYINENLRNALVTTSAGKGHVPVEPIQKPMGPLRIRYEPDTDKLFITVSEFRKYFASKQVDVQESVRLLVESGIMANKGVAEVKRIGGGVLGGYPSVGIRCYIFHGDAIGLDETAFTHATGEESESGTSVLEAAS